MPRQHPVVAEITPAQVSRADVAAGLGQLGIAPGDTVFFHSSLSSMGHVVGGPETVVAGILDLVGPTGTIVVPTFTLTERLGPFGSWYDHETTASSVGLLTETLRRRPDALRSYHPTHSMAAVGRLARMVTAQHRYAFGRISPWCDAGFAQGSPFDLLVRWNAWYVLLGVSFQVQTLMHYLETILVDSVLRRASGRERDVLRAQIRRWGDTGGLWPAPDRTRLGEALAADGTYARTTIGNAAVYGNRFQTILRRALQVVLRAPEQWLTSEFCAWMGKPPDPEAVYAEYAAPKGGPPLAAPALAVSCAGRARASPA